MAGKLDRLLRPRSIAIVGASPRPTSPGARVLSNLIRCGYEGSIALINPSRTELEGRPCVPSVDALSPDIDLAALCIPKESIGEALQACARRRIGAAVVFAAGYAEQDDDGAAEQERLVEISRDAGIALLGPNCLGFINAFDGVPITITTNNPPPAIKPGVGIIAQSGAFMSSLRATMELKRIPASMLISVGNQAVLGAEDFLEDMIEDANTRVVAIFAERLREPQRFLQLASRARAARKPIVLMHTGRSARAQEAAQSHTGALAGDHAVMRALSAHESVILVDTLDELADIAALLCRYPNPPTAGVGLVTNSGALRGLTFDYCEDAELDVPEIAQATKEKMAPRLPAFAVVENPIDLTVQSLVEPELVGLGAKALADDPNIGSVVLAVHAGLEAAEYAKHAGPMLAASEKPIAYAILGEGSLVSPELLAALAQGELLLFRSVERALGAVARITAYGRSLHWPARRTSSLDNRVSLPRAGTLAEHEGKGWIGRYGIHVPDGVLAQSVAEAEEIAAQIGFPVVLKAQARNLAHKSDAGGVILGINDTTSLRSAWSQLQDNVCKNAPGLALDGVLVERMGSPGVEMVLGLRRDPNWGPVLLIGFGGILIEIMNDVRLMPVDLSEDAIVAEILKLRGARLLQGARGAPPSDVRAVARAAMLLGDIARAHPEITEIDINPLVVYPESHGAVALDVLVVSSDAAAAAPSGTKAAAKPHRRAVEAAASF
jgi:acetate---CoA ligase (ADP-forming)